MSTTRMVGDKDMKKKEGIDRLMKDFWDSRAKDNAPFYIATWRGYKQEGTKDFFIGREQVKEFAESAGYQPTGQDRMLEIGCGIGRMTHGFAELFGTVDAIDVSPEMISQAIEHQGASKNIVFRETNGIDLGQFMDDVFDFVFSFIVFQHIPAKKVIFSYIHEGARVLRPGGVFRFQVNGLPDADAETPTPILALKRLYRRLVRTPILRLQRRLTGGPTGFESPAWIGVSLTAAEVFGVCHDAGLNVRQITGEDTQYMWITATK
jgi:SAM-dependent methyltransferase